MARRSISQIERELEYAKKKAAYKPAKREEGAATRRIPRITVRYRVLSPLAPANLAYTIEASKEGVEFFGRAALGLGDPATDPEPSRGFKPYRLMATVADGSPQLVHAKGSTRPYIRYARGNRGSNVQSSFTAPICADTAANFDNVVRAALTGVKAKLGGAYGRAWLEPEDYPLSISG